MIKARENPFATDRVHTIRYRFSAQQWDEFERRLREMEYRGAIVGPEGAGKTTLLEDLEARLQRHGRRTRRLRLTREKPAFERGELRRLFAEVDERDVFLFDGAEQLTPWAWRRFKQRSRVAGGLVITSHRGGMLPTLIECRTSPRLLFDIVCDLLEARSDGEAGELRRLTDSFFAAHRGNIREALRAMYDWCAAGEAEAEPWRSALCLRRQVSA